MKGVFAWITCPKSLKLFAEEMKLSNREIPSLQEIIELAPKQRQCIATSNSDLILKGKKSKHIVLEEYSFILQDEEQSQSLAEFGEWLSQNILPENSLLWADKLKKDIVILPNDDFKDFVNSEYRSDHKNQNR